MQQFKQSPADTILALFEYSWGEVDWILPVLHELKLIKPEWRILALFSPYWDFANEKVFDSLSNRTLSTELNRIVDDVIHINQNNIEIPGISHPEQVRIILKDFNGDTPFKSSIQNVFPTAKIVAHAHGTLHIITQKRNCARNNNLWEKNTVKHDLMIVNTQIAATTYYSSFSNARYAVVGFPTYDRAWSERLVHSQDYTESVEAKRAASATRVFTFFAVPSYPMFPPDIFDYVLRSITEVILGEEGNFLFIRTHPRQNISDLSAYLKPYDPSKYMISTLHPMQLAALSDLVIAVPTSCILDSLSVGKPVIEFFPIVNIHYGFVLNRKGWLETTTRVLDLVVPANTKEELSGRIDDFFNNMEDRSPWNKQQEAFKKFCRPDDRASRGAANVILSLIEPGRGNENHLPAIHHVWSPISGDSRVFLTRLKENENQDALYLELKRIKAYGMSITTIMLREIVKVLGAEILVVTGTLSEHLAGEASKIFREVHAIELAADLYQPILMPEIAGSNNIHIYNSANVLRLILPNLKGRILFLLSTHESAVITTKSRTNNPVIEELRVIKECRRNDSTILIDNMRYFQPIVTQEDEAAGNKERKYSTVQEALNAILDIDPTHQFAILGDAAIAYPANNLVETSMGVRACTLSRLFDGRNIDIVSVLEAENMIAFGLEGTEKEAIKCLHKDYLSMEEPGVGGHYRFWNGLTLFGEGCYHEAREEFADAMALNCNHWRVAWLLAESASRVGQNALAKETMERYTSFEHPGAVGLYFFWKGLTFYGEQRYRDAKEEMLRAAQSDFKHWRTFWFLADSAYKEGDNAMAKDAARSLLNSVPDFEPAKTLLERIE